MHFRVSHKAKVQNGGYIFGLLKVQISFWGLLEILDIFLGVKGRCWARAYV